MVEKPIWFGQNHRIVVDDEANTWKLQFYNSADATWYDIMSYNTSNQSIAINPLIRKVQPYVTLEGTEDGGMQAIVGEHNGRVIAYDLDNDILLTSVHKGKPLVYDILFCGIFEKDSGDLAADSTGVKFDTQMFGLGAINYAEKVAIDARWLATHDDSVTKIGVYDITDDVYICSLSGNKSGDTISDFGTMPVNHYCVVRVEVTTASATSGAKTKVEKAIVYRRIDIR